MSFGGMPTGNFLPLLLLKRAERMIRLVENNKVQGIRPMRVDMPV